MLKDWINEAYLQEKKILALRKQCAAGKPFSHLYLNDFFVPQKIDAVAQALRKLRFDRRRSDLFTFGQTMLKGKVLLEFVEFYNSAGFREYVQRITGVRGLKYIDSTGFCYSDTDYLLPHDDRMPGRKVAYVVNLSSLFSARDGGQLDLFKGHCVGKSYVPRYNSLVLFPVSRKSLHQVREVVSKKKRYTVAGWFYG